MYHIVDPDNFFGCILPTTNNRKCTKTSQCVIVKPLLGNHIAGCAQQAATHRSALILT
jgi:hypothetical protein